MKNIFHDKNWNKKTVQVHVDPPTILFIKSNNDDKSDKYFCKRQIV